MAEILTAGFHDCPGIKGMNARLVPGPECLYGIEACLFRAVGQLLTKFEHRRSSHIHKPTTPEQAYNDLHRHNVYGCRCSLLPLNERLRSLALVKKHHFRI
jgi:hypothetical protein